MSDEPHANIIVENVKWHTFYDLLDEMEQLAKNKKYSPKPAERLLERTTHLPWLVRAHCQKTISLWGWPLAIWHAEMAMYMLRVEILGRELESAEESLTIEKVELAQSLLEEVKARAEKDMLYLYDLDEEETDKDVIAAYHCGQSRLHLHMLRWQLVQFSKVASALVKIWPDA